MQVKLAFPQDSPPLSIISAAKIAGVPIIIDPTLASGSVPTLHFSSGDFIHGVNTILRYIARAASVSSFYGQDDIQAAHALNLKLLAPFLMDTWQLEPFWLVMVYQLLTLLCGQISQELVNDGKV